MGNLDPLLGDSGSEFLIKLLVILPVDTIVSEDMTEAGDSFQTHVAVSRRL